MASKKKSKAKGAKNQAIIMPGDVLAVDGKAAQTPADITAAAKASVREPSPTGMGGGRIILFQMALAADEAPAWWSPQRDAWLRSFWPSAPFLPGVIYSMCGRNAAFRFEFTGPDKQVQYAKDLCAQADLGAGWQSLVMKLSQDLYTQDNFAFIEVIRPARVRTSKGLLQAVKALDSNGEMAWFAAWRGQLIPIDPEDPTKEYKIEDDPADLPLGIAHLDAGRCVRTGDLDYPVNYQDRKGIWHKLAWWQVITLEDMPSPIEDMNGVGLCAVSRVLRVAQVLRDVAVYKHEKLSGRNPSSIWLTNVDADAISGAVKQSEARADAQGYARYMKPIIAQILDPQADPKAVELALKSLPDGYNEETTLRWYITELALGTGTDYSYFAPLPGSGLGTASQVETMARQTKGKAPRLFMNMIEFKFRYHGILPSDVDMNFREIDEEEQLAKDTATQRRAETRSVRIASGEITPQVARHIAVDDGDLEPDYLDMMEEEEAVPEETTEPSPEVTEESGEPEGGAGPGDVTEEPEAKGFRKWFKAVGDRLQLRRRGSGYEGKVNAYAEKLVKAFDGWALKWAPRIARASEMDRDPLIIEAAEEIDATMQGIAEEGLEEAYLLGLEGEEMTDAGYVQVRNYTDRNLRFLEYSLKPDLQTKLKALGAEGLKDADAVAGALGTFRARVATYAGPYWVLVHKGMEERAKGQEQAEGRQIPVTWHLDGKAVHCDDCPKYAGTYKSWDEMEATTGGVPSSGNSACGCNCRCYVTLGG